MRWLDRLYAKHPFLTMCAVIAVMFLAIYVKTECEQTDTDLSRWQLSAARTT